MRKLHHLSRDEYYDMFNTRLRCKGCDKKLRIDYSGKSGFCKSCNDKNRFGENNSFFGKKHTQETIESNRIKQRAASTALWENEDYRTRVITNSSKPRKKQFGIEQRERVLKWYEEHPEQRELRSTQMKKSWDDGLIEPHVNSVNESKQERQLRAALAAELPGMEVCKKSLKLDGRWLTPDVIINDKYIIEFFGTMWHADPCFYRPDDITHRDNIAKDVWVGDAERVSKLELMGLRCEDRLASGFPSKRAWSDR